MQLNNQANYLGLVFLRIDNIGAYVSLFNLYFTVEQQHLSPRTSTVPRLPVTARKPPQDGLGGTGHLPAHTSLSLEGPSTTQADTAPPALEQELQGGDREQQDSLRSRLAEDTTLLSRNGHPRAARRTRTPIPTTHLCPSFFSLFFFKD